MTHLPLSGGTCRPIAVWMGVLCLALVSSIAAQASDRKPDQITAIPFAEVDGRELLLDLYLPALTDRPPLVVYVHGGAWRSGSRSRMPLTYLIEDGFAVASVDYRLSPEAKFPAQIHDIKAAIRFLGAKATVFGYDADAIGIAGSSAGGHLAALVGVTNGHSQLEGNVGSHLGESSDVHAVVSYFGASNLLTILSQSTPKGLDVRVPALKLLLGGLPEDHGGAARLASPVHHVDVSDPPLYLLHGDQDPQMPINQAHELHGAYQSKGLPVIFDVVYGGGHGGDSFHDAARSRSVSEFLSEHLR
ncbi:MAG: alpha/beta hydrolase [Bryobacterales bacterium]|nr:alpha/beta hydrolase [Bryobacterales bacterium]MDE0620490.1 alpha/beta hydrolase [Bryobacterales bacterium]